MFNAFKQRIKGVKRHMDENIRMCKEILGDTRTKLTFGLVLIGVGIGIITSIYMPVPAA